MHRNVWQARFTPDGPSKCAFKTDTKKSIHCARGDRNNFLEMKRHSQRAVKVMVSRAIKKSHNNQTLLDDLSHSSCDECTNDPLFGKIKVFSLRLSKKKSKSSKFGSNLFFLFWDSNESRSSQKTL